MPLSRNLTFQVQRHYPEPENPEFPADVSNRKVTAKSNAGCWFAFVSLRYCSFPEEKELDPDFGVWGWNLSVICAIFLKERPTSSFTAQHEYCWAIDSSWSSQAWVAWAREFIKMNIGLLHQPQSPKQWIFFLVAPCYHKGQLIMPLCDVHLCVCLRPFHDFGQLGATFGRKHVFTPNFSWPFLDGSCHS